MNEKLIQYLNRRFYGNEQIKATNSSPFITISRETGCQSYQLAVLLQNSLRKENTSQWSIVTKEAIASALLDQKLDPLQVESILNAEERSHITEILKAFETKAYKSDKMVRGILKQFIANLAQRGHVIIIGRAGALITKDYPAGIHIRLIAPLEWRVRNIMEQKSISHKMALEYIVASDERRNKLMANFSDKTNSAPRWDIVFNNNKFSAEEMAEMILALMIRRSGQFE